LFFEKNQSGCEWLAGAMKTSYWLILTTLAERTDLGLKLRPDITDLKMALQLTEVTFY
jgi:hypothetical protein